LKKREEFSVSLRKKKKNEIIYLKRKKAASYQEEEAESPQQVSQGEMQDKQISEVMQSI